MSELNDNSELQKYSSAVLYVLSAVDPPEEYVGVIASNFLQAIKSSTVSSHQVLTFSVAYIPSVLAYPSQGTSHATRFLLPKPHEYTRGHNVEDHGSSSRLPSR